jgi:transposase
VVLFADEAGFSLHPKLGRVWVKKGTQPYVYTRSSHSYRLNVYGWVDPVSGRHGMMKHARGNTVGFVAFLRRIATTFRQTAVELWVDQAKWHKAPEVLELLAEERTLTISYIPKYHPELNLQERLWKTMRYEETTNTYYDTATHLEHSVMKRSQRWRPAKLKALCHLI